MPVQAELPTYIVLYTHYTFYVQSLLSSLEAFQRQDAFPSSAVHPLASTAPDACGPRFIYASIFGPFFLHSSLQFAWISSTTTLASRFLWCVAGIAKGIWRKCARGFPVLSSKRHLSIKIRFFLLHNTRFCWTWWMCRRGKVGTLVLQQDRSVLGWKS